MTIKPDAIVHMTPASESANWWAAFLLELGKNAEYDLLLQYLELAQKNGCLNAIRLAAEEQVRLQSRASVVKKPKGLVKVRKSGTLKAVA